MNTEDRTVEAVKRANTADSGPHDDLVAVKVQYPDALTLFVADLGNIRRLAGFLEKTELAFDLISAVDELSSQVKLEFDFKRYGACLPSLQVMGNFILCNPMR